MRRMAWLGATCAVGLAGSSAGGSTVAQQPVAPTDDRGIRVEPLTDYDLTGTVEGLAGRRLSLMLIMIEPGGHVGLHEHTGRRGNVVVVEGAIVDHRVGGGSREYRAGQAFTEPADVRHWLENRGTAPAVLLAVDVFRP